MPNTTHLQCACGHVCLETTGTPIASAECPCDSCRAAAARLQALPDAPRVRSANGGTPFVLYRKDRMRFAQGRDLLRSFGLTGDSRTRRVVASCRHTQVFLEFENGHWLSLYGCLWPPQAMPALELRTMTGDLPDPSALPDDVPNMRRQSGRFFAKLLGAWIAMGFRTPERHVEGDLHA